jgi:hypothetical protein
MESELFCQKCKAPIQCKDTINGDLVWLELDQKKLTYHLEGIVSEENSQGFFPFGKKCAEKTLKNQKTEE